MRRKNYVVLVLLLFLSCLFLWGCEQKKENNQETKAESFHDWEGEDELIFAVNIDSGVSETYLQCTWMNRSQFWGGLVFQGLLIADGNISNVRPDLCEEYIISPDGTKYVFLLREDVYWHDGEKLTPDDVVWSIENSFRVAQINGYVQKGLKNIKGVKEYQEGKAAHVSGVTVEGNAITVELTKKDNMFLNSIAQLAILPKHCLEDVSMDELDKADFWKQPIGSGPYKVAGVNDGKEVLFVVNENYTGKIPHIKRIKYKILENPESDEFDFAMTSDPDTINKYMDNPKYEVKKTSNLYYRYLFFNLDGRSGDRAQLLQDEKIRQALVMALDREAILKSVYGDAAVFMDGGIPSEDSWYISKEEMGLEYQPQTAKKILTEQGFDFTQAIVLTRYHEDDMSVKLLQEMADYWNAIGIHTVIEPIDTTQTDKLWQDTDWYDVALKNLSAVDYTEWYFEYSTQNQLWSGVLHRSEFDSLIDAIGNTSMAKEKNRLYYEIQQLESTAVYKIPICILPQYVIYNKEHISIPDINFPNMWFYFDLDIEDWKFVE